MDYFGGGVVIEKSSTGFDVLTADHVLGENRNVIVQSWTGEKLSKRLQTYTAVSVMARDPEKDRAYDVDEIEIRDFMRQVGLD